LRGGWLDVFGYTHERRQERALIQRYRDTLVQVMALLRAGPQQPDAAQRHALALELAQIPEHIRGYGHVKARHLARVLPQWDALTTRLNA